MTNDWYTPLARRVEDAGLHTNGLNDEGRWARTVVCSKRDANGHLTGNSFWIACIGRQCYVATWAPHIYRLGDGIDPGRFCIEYLTRCPDGTRHDFDDEAKRFGALEELQPDVFDRLISEG